ncbi:MAG: helix-turn-helix transcriptional regulator [Bacteroidales bacterium]|nr:helix-turn-helix transcriptional regulator [Bacteroidales bacterium]
MNDFIHYRQKKNIHLYLLIFSIFFISICFFQIKNLNAQEQFNITEYLESLGNYHDDSLAHILYKKSQDFINADSLEIANELLVYSIEIAQEQNDTLLIGSCKLTQGKVFNELLNYRNSFQAYNSAYDISKQSNDTVLMIQAMNGIERYYYQLELIDSAITYCVAALNINKLRNNYTELSDNYGRLYSYQRYTTGEVLLNTFVLDGLIDSSLKAAIKSEDRSLLCYVITGFGLAKYDTDIEKAFEYMQAARDSARKLPAPSKELVYTLTKSSVICLRYNQTKQARIYLYEALPLAEKTNYTSQLTHINFLMGDLLNAEDSITQAIPYYYKAIELAEKYRHKYYLPFIYNTLFEIYQSNENLDKSDKFQQKYMEVFRKNHNREMNIQIAKLSAKYQIDSKNETIDDLTIINNQKKIIIANQKRFIILLLITFLAVSTLLIILYRQLKKIRKAHWKLSQNTLELNIKNKEIAELKKKRDLKLEVVHDELKDKLEELFVNQEIFTNKNLTLSSTAMTLKTNTSYLSALINKDYKCNFNQFVNKYRIEKACEYLRNRKMDIYSVEGIAEMVGFKSKSAFNQAFKDTTGITPSTFRNNTIKLQQL